MRCMRCCARRATTSDGCCAIVRLGLRGPFAPLRGLLAVLATALLAVTGASNADPYRMA